MKKKKKKREILFFLQQSACINENKHVYESDGNCEISLVVLGEETSFTF